ncbi:hypothetical protein BLA29_007483 [Euroglyphus maynei]|uniref:Long-chain-fatty-acid--CoA ligase n=1 Tax=Euroglyphus maynei TaxID=6958 RepID=A0A1Y3BP59_EURMA|nr:hypothetical protein BLA29_007483 [Euroglyphus maynei]
MWMTLTKQTIVHSFDHIAHRNRNRTAIIHQGRSYAFHELEDLANRISNWFEKTLQIYCDDEYEEEQLKKQQLEQQQNDSSSGVLNLVRRHQNTKKIGLMFQNVPELASFIIGIGRVRCASVLFNYNHRNDSLVNAFEASNCQMFIFESKFLPALKEIATRLPDGIRFVMYDRNIRNEANVFKYDDHRDYKGFTRDDLINDNIVEKDEKFSQILDLYPVTKVRKNYPYKMQDICAYIFTSGTTGGKIKAAAVNNYRFLAIDLLMCYAFDIKQTENIYICVPGYHGLGCIMGIGSTMVNGNMITLAEKFSATNFWKDCYENQCTVSNNHSLP